MASRRWSASSAGTNTTSLSMAGPVAPVSGARSVSPRARPIASETPSTARSALVWAVSRAQPAPARALIVRPLGVVAANPCTGFRNRGWCTNSRSAPHSAASAATSGAGSTANSTLPTVAAGSPYARPTASQESAVSGGYHPWTRSTISRSVGMEVTVTLCCGGYLTGISVH